MGREGSGELWLQITQQEGIVGIPGKGFFPRAFTSERGKPSLAVLIPCALSPPRLRVPCFLKALRFQQFLLHGTVCADLWSLLLGPPSLFAGRKAETQRGRGAGHSCLCTRFGYDVLRSWSPSLWLQAMVEIVAQPEPFTPCHQHLAQSLACNSH